MLKSVKTAVAITAPAYIETHEVEAALRSALYAHDRRLRDLHEEFHTREIRLRDEYLVHGR